MTVAALVGFDVFAEQDLGELIEEKLKALLEADDELCQWAPEVVILPDPFAIPSLRLPWIGITVGSDATGQQPNTEGERTIDALILVAYDEPRRERIPGERSIKAARHRIARAIWADPTLGDTVHRLNAFETVRYDVLKFQDGSSSTMLQLRVEYLAFVNLTTQLPA